MRHVILVIALIVCSCDYALEQKVLVLDRKSDKPIENAKIDIQGYNCMTDSTGFCEIQEITGLLSDRTILVTKEGFSTFEIHIIRESNEWQYSQKVDSTFKPVNNFGIKSDTLIVYLEGSK
ncbi:hypothetical protein [Algoriphagus aquimarinus]|uniref:Carboxypeptidase regulatory-like domain-containing protein n=1 Tax=Algoriphagus aquimarinus TaxID=237018 RepID=A0A5C7AXT0_9BACT|nr:hypothetical protein [Algoriphagus aquimarinus]TXE12379.1 hypothetical protein ESV85_10130 [Algoriphagus aquimarinus]